MIVRTCRFRPSEKILNLENTILKTLLILTALASASFINTANAADVGVSVTIGQPGFYGRIDIGDYPTPRVIYRQPRVVERVYESREPIYLHVPPGHAKHWGKHCHEYNACGERVYFVRDDWYNNEYAPRYQESHRPPPTEYREESNDHGNGEFRGGPREEHREDRQDEYNDQRKNHKNSEHDHGHER